jgi:Protein of unknown function (DUF3040)
VSTQEVRLSAEERAALASIEAKAAAEDPQLAALLKGSSRQWVHAVPRRVGGIVMSGWRALVSHGWWGFLIAAIGLALMATAMSAGLIVGLVGAVLAAAGLRLGFQALDEWRRRSRTHSG